MAVTCIYGECYRSSQVHETNIPAVRHNSQRAIHYSLTFILYSILRTEPFKSSNPFQCYHTFPPPATCRQKTLLWVPLSAPLDILPCKHCQVYTQVWPGCRFEVLQDMQPITAATNQHQLSARPLYSAHMLPGSCCTATLDEQPAKTMPDNRSIASQHRQTSITR